MGRRVKAAWRWVERGGVTAGQLGEDLCTGQGSVPVISRPDLWTCATRVQGHRCVHSSSQPPWPPLHRNTGQRESLYCDHGRGHSVACGRPVA